MNTTATKKQITNFATKAELISIINEFKKIIASSFGCEKTYFEKQLKDSENDLTIGNYYK